MRALIVVVTIGLLLSGCAEAPPYMLNAWAMQPDAMPALIRHDRYVSNDPALSSDEKDRYLQESYRVRQMMVDAMGADR